MSEEKFFDLREAVMSYHHELTGEEALFEDEAFYDIVDFTDFLFDKLIRLEKKVERLKKILDLSDDEELEEEELDETGVDTKQEDNEYDDLDCEADE